MIDSSLDSFIVATRTTFDGLLQLDVSPGASQPGDADGESVDVSGIVGISWKSPANGMHHASVVLAFAEPVARRVVARLLDMEDEPVSLDQNAADAIAELVNVVVGQAKRGLAGGEVADCRASLPTVVLGAQHRVFRKRGHRAVVTRFTSDLGAFELKVLHNGEGGNGPRDYIS